MAKLINKLNYPSIHLSTDNTQILCFDSITSLINDLEFSSEENQKRFFVTDATVASLDCMKEFVSKFDDGKCNNDCLLILGSGEPYKTFESVERIIIQAIESDFNRNDMFIGIGGGVICDITAFAASIFKRGAKVSFVPTTLLSMVDASIGGKTGCDFENYKNMIGSFYPASKIYIWPGFIKFLPENQYRSGLAEVIKTAIIGDKELFNVLQNQSENIMKREDLILEFMITHCINVKSNIVHIDFMEQNIRAFLNLGHTFGHALESIVGLGAITHGEAVAWGLGRIANISLDKGYCSQEFYESIISILNKYNYDTTAIPEIVKGGEIGNRFISIMHKDKKNKNNQINLVIPKDIGNIVVEQIENDEILNVLK